VVSAVLCFVPLLNLLGYEFSLVLALVSSFAAGHIAAGYPDRVRNQLAPYPGAQGTVVRLYLVVVTMALALLVLPLALISLNALRVQNCDPWEGGLFFLLGPGCSVAVAAARGLVCGLLVNRRRLASLLWLLVWCGSLAAVLYELWATPSVQALGSMHGYFSGVLYDENVSVPWRWVTYRARDFIEVVTLLGGAALLVDRSNLRLRFGLLSERSAGLLRWLPWAGVALVVAFLAPRLGHRCSTGELARVLGGHRTLGPCELYYPAELSDEDAARLVRDCVFNVEDIQAFFGVELVRPVRVYLFASPDHKQELIGAGRTSVAKPWRGEVYIQGMAFPHPVLKHEIAHVVAATFGASPLQVSGRWGGLLVSPGMVEGAAVAADWRGAELTPHQWSRAMHDLDVAPPMESVLGLRFFGLNASRAYVLAGSFSRYLIDEYGPTRYRQAYRTADVAGTYGRLLDSLELEWLEFLQEQPLRPGDLELARDRFVRPPVHRKVCVHEVAQLRDQAADCAARGDWPGAVALRRRVAEFLPDDATAQWELAEQLVWAGRRPRAHEALAQQIEDSSRPLWLRQAARSLRGDLQWVAGQQEEAAAAYGQLAEEPLREATRRLLAVKQSALAQERATPYVRRFLLGGNPWGPEEYDTSLLTLALLTNEEPSYAIGHYLLGRQLWQRGHARRALPFLERARRLGLEPEIIAAENSRLIALARFDLGQFRRAKAWFERLADDSQRPAGARAQAEAWVARCDWELSRRR
jgi:tetratricopeptide (TPR) repeat protein